MGNERSTTLDIAKVNSMFTCGSVTPSTLNAILFVDIICPVKGEYERFRYVYVYQELLSYFHLFELEVASKWEHKHTCAAAHKMLKYISPLEHIPRDKQSMTYAWPAIYMHIYQRNFVRSRPYLLLQCYRECV